MRRAVVVVIGFALGLSAHAGAAYAETAAVKAAQGSPGYERRLEQA